MYVKSYGFFNLKCHNFIGQASISMEPSPACSLRGSVQQAMTMDGVLSPFEIRQTMKAKSQVLRLLFVFILNNLLYY